MVTGMSKCQRVLSSFFTSGGEEDTMFCGKPAKWAFHYRYAVTDLDRALAKLVGDSSPVHDTVGFTCLCEEHEPTNQFGNLEKEWKRMICKCGYHPCRPEEHAGWSPE